MVYAIYPAVDEGYNFPPEVREALAASSDLRNQVVPMSQTERNNLSGADLWDGRTIVNTTTKRINRYDSGTGGWGVVIETTDLNTEVAALDARLDLTETVITSLDSRMDAQEAYVNARVLSTSAGLQQNVNGRWYLDTGFGAPRMAPPVFAFSRDVSGTQEIGDIKADGYDAGSGVVYVTGSGFSLGLPYLVTRID